MQKYDLIFYKGNNVLGRLIRWITNSPYSHVAMYLGDNHIVEANYFNTLRVKHLKYKRHQYDVYRVKDLNNEHYCKIDEYIKIHVNSKYDYRELLRILFPFMRIKDNLSKLICSEFIYDCFNYAGICLLDNDITTPNDLSGSKEIYAVD